MSKYTSNEIKACEKVSNKELYDLIALTLRARTTPSDYVHVLLRELYDRAESKNFNQAQQQE